MAKFSIFTEPPEFKPRNKFGLRKGISREDREFLDAFDVMEQKMDYSLNIAARAHNLVVLVIIVNLLINGPAIIRVFQGWLGHPPQPLAAIFQWFNN